MYTQAFQKYHLSASPPITPRKVRRCQPCPPDPVLAEGRFSGWLTAPPPTPSAKAEGGITPLPVTHSVSALTTGQEQQAIQPILYQSLIQRPNSDFLHCPSNAIRAILIFQDPGHNCTLTMLCLQCPLTWAGPPQSSSFLTMTFSRAHASSVECLVVSLP